MKGFSTLRANKILWLLVRLTMSVFYMLLEMEGGNESFVGAMRTFKWLEVGLVR
jgi:hypothetical protein